MNKITTLDELKDSKLLYEKDVPHFGYFLLLILLVLVIAVSLWSTHAKKPYIVIANGIMQGTDKNYVLSEFSGKIYDVNMSEGQEVEEGQVLFRIKSPDIDIQLNQLEIQRKSYNSTAKKYGKLVKSIKKDKSYFSSKKKSDSLYYSQYKAYKAKLAQTQQTISADALRQAGYTDQEIQDEINRIEAEKKGIYYDAINNASLSQKQCQQEIDAIDSQIKALKSGEANYVVKAPTSGKIHMLGEYKEGVVIQAANAIASISEVNDEDAVIKATVAASDRSRIHTGDEVKIVAAGLQQNVYGTLSGKVTNIDTDISVGEGNQGAYFNIEIKPESTVLKSKDGETVNITNGMTVEARIIYDKITYFDYVMNTIGVKVMQ